MFQTAGAKGLVVGISCPNEVVGVDFQLISGSVSLEKYSKIEQAKWILVIEKEVHCVRI